MNAVTSSGRKNVAPPIRSQPIPPFVTFSGAIANKTADELADMIQKAWHVLGETDVWCIAENGRIRSNLINALPPRGER